MMFLNLLKNVLKLLFILSFFMVWGCYEAEQSGVEGVVNLGNGQFASSRAKRIFIAFFDQSDFDSTKQFIKEGAKPLFTKEISDLANIPYTFSFNLEKGGVNGYFFAFLDQDNSGGELPSAGDIYGFYPSSPDKDTPISLGAFRVKDIKISMNKVFAKPPIPIEISLTNNIKISDNAKKIIFGFWKYTETSKSLPKINSKPLLNKELTDLTQTKWTFKLSTKEAKSEAIPFAFLDQDDDGKFSKGDAYGTWSRSPFDLEKIYTDLIQLTIKETYQP